MNKKDFLASQLKYLFLRKFFLMLCHKEYPIVLREVTNGRGRLFRGWDKDLIDRGTLCAC